MKTIRILFFFDQKISSFILTYFQLECNPNHNTTWFFILLTNFCRKKISPNLKAQSTIGFLLQKCQNKGPVKIRHITLVELPYYIHRKTYYRNTYRIQENKLVVSQLKHRQLSRQLSDHLHFM